jgi:hypothetical protein
VTEQELRLLQEIAASTRAIAQLLAVSLPKGFTSRLSGTLDSDAKRTAYQVSDGVRSAREVARLSETSHPTIGRWWADWESRGLAEATTDGRVRAVFDLRLVQLPERLEEGLT